MKVLFIMILILVASVPLFIFEHELDAEYRKLEGNDKHKNDKDES